MFRKIILSFSVFLVNIFLVSQVSAIAFVEPGVGYQIATFKQNHGLTNGNANQEMSANTSGLSFDLKAGLDFMNIFAGPYLNVTLPSFSASNGWAQLSSDVSANTQIAVGAIAGYRLPMIALKGYAGYQFLQQIDLTGTSGGSNNAYYKGTGFLFGLGYELDLIGGFKLSINAQYSRETYNAFSNVIGNFGKTEFTLPAYVADSDTNFSDVYFEKATADRVLVFVSVPLRF